jgi:hypothetical protein
MWSEVRLLAPKRVVDGESLCLLAVVVLLDRPIDRLVHHLFPIVILPVLVVRKVAFGLPR